MISAGANLKYQFAGKGAGKLLALLFYVFLARMLGEEGFGEFSYALVICFIFGQPLVLMGQDVLVTKWVSRGKAGVLRSAFQVWALSSLAGAVVLISLSLFISVNRPVLYLLLAYLIFLIFEEILYAYRRGQEDMKLEGVFFPLQRFFVLALVLVFAWFGVRDPAAGAAALFLPACLGGMVLTWMMKDDIAAAFRSRENRIGTRSLFKEGMELSAVTFLWMIYFRVDSFMLGALADMQSVGIYNGAYRLVEGLFFLPGVILMVYFPGLARKAGFRKKFLKILLLLSVPAILVSGGLFILSPLVIKILYAGDFAGSVPVLRILCLALFVIFAGHLTTQSMIALDMNRAYLVIAGAGVLMNVILNFFAIPVYGAQGAAMVTVITEAFVALATGGSAWLKSASL